MPPWLEIALQVEAAPTMPGGVARAPTRRRSRSGGCTARSASWKPPSRRRPAQGQIHRRHQRACHRKSAEELLRLYKEQSGVERGFAFLKDPLFLASSVFVKKVERVMATGFVMVLCLLVYRLAEHRIRQRLAETGATVPDQLKKPTQRPTLRWVFQCFEGISLVLMEHEEQGGSRAGDRPD